MDLDLPGLWARLTEPSGEIKKPDERRRVRLLLSVLVVIIALGLGSGLAQLVLVAGFLATFLTILAGIGVLTLAYVLVRSGRYEPGAFITCFAPTAASLAVLLVNPADTAAFAYFLVGVVLASMLLGIRAAASISVVNVIAIAALPVLDPAWTVATIAGPLGFNVVIPALLLLFMRHRDSLELDRQCELLERDKQVRALNEELEARVRARTAQLEAANKGLETFTYTVSHDLKAPLRGIDGYCHLLLEDHAARLDEKGLQYLRNVRKAAQKLDALINDLLDYSRLERSDLALASVEPRAVIDALLEEYADDISAQGVAVRVTANCAPVLADRSGLTMALRNLIGNALKFTRGATRPELEIGCSEDATSHRLWVRDNGEGFDMKYREQIFAVFQRLHHGEEYPGTGVGLAIVRKAMERIGGRAWAESEPGKGAIFYLEIPK